MAQVQPIAEIIRLGYANPIKGKSYAPLQLNVLAALQKADESLHDENRDSPYALDFDPEIPVDGDAWRAFLAQASADMAHPTFRAGLLALVTWGIGGAVMSTETIGVTASRSTWVAQRVLPSGDILMVQKSLAERALSSGTFSLARSFFNSLPTVAGGSMATDKLTSEIAKRYGEVDLDKWFAEQSIALEMSSANRVAFWRAARLTDPVVNEAVATVAYAPEMATSVQHAIVYLWLSCDAGLATAGDATDYARSYVGDAAAWLSTQKDANLGEGRNQLRDYAVDRIRQFSYEMPPESAFGMYDALGTTDFLRQKNAFWRSATTGDYRTFLKSWAMASLPLEEATPPSPEGQPMPEIPYNPNPGAPPPATPGSPAMPPPPAPRPPSSGVDCIAKVEQMAAAIRLCQRVTGLGPQETFDFLSAAFFIQGQEPAAVQGVVNMLIRQSVLLPRRY